MKDYHILENKNWCSYTSDSRFNKPKNKNRKIFKRRVRRTQRNSEINEEMEYYVFWAYCEDWDYDLDEVQE